MEKLINVQESKKVASQMPLIDPLHWHTAVMTSIPRFVSVVIGLWIVMAPFQLWGQGQILDRYVEEGIAQNLKLQNEQLALEQQLLKVKEAKGRLMPVVYLDASYGIATGGRTLEVPIGDWMNTQSALLNEQLETQSFSTDYNNYSEAFTPNNFHDTRIKATYSLFNQKDRYYQQIQEQLVGVQQLKKQTYLNNLKKEIKVAYYNYLKTIEVLKIFQTTDQLLLQLKRFNEKLVTHNKATTYTVSSVAYEMAKVNSQRALLEQQQQAAKAYFNTLLNRSIDAEIESDTTLQLTAINWPTSNELRQYAIQQRPELQQIKEGIAVNESLLELHRKAVLPTLELQASAGFQGFGYQFNKEQAIATLGVGTTFYLYDGKQHKQRIAQLEIASAQLQKEQSIAQQNIELQVVNAYHAYSVAQQQLQTAISAQKSAKKSFDLVRKLYENNKVLLIEYLDVQTKYTTAQISLSVAQFDVFIRQAELDQALNQ